MLLPVLFLSELLTTFKIYLFINKTPNFHSSSSSRFAVHQLTSLPDRSSIGLQAHQPINLLTYQLTNSPNLSQIILNSPPCLRHHVI